MTSTYTYPDALSTDSEERPLLSRGTLTQELSQGTTQTENDDEGSFAPNYDFSEGPRADVERSLVRKLDRRMSILILIYILNYIDRNNASAARLRGFEEDLHLEGNQFASILSILYVGYIFMQIPSNMLLVRIGKPSMYLPACMVVWGCISALTGATTNFFGALCTRFFLGFVEAAFFPGALFLISKWYKKDELSRRTAFLFCGNLISNAFGTLIASAILDIMDGVLGLTAWRWLFFVEGFLTVVVAVIAMHVLPDFPETPCSWLTPAERALAMHRMVEDAGVDADVLSIEDNNTATEDPLTKETSKAEEGLYLALSDWKVWWLVVAMAVLTVSLSFNAFFPTLSATMGFSTTTTLLLCAPPWVFSTIAAVIVSSHSDRTGERFWHIAAPFFVACLGFFLSIWTMNTIVRYLSLFLMAQAYSGYVCFLAWATGTFSQPSSKRAVALALIVSGATVGNFLGSYVWPSSWGPSYSYSYGICILCVVISTAMCFAFRQHLASLNKSGRGHQYLL